jgi:hypothetical protein
MKTLIACALTLSAATPLAAQPRRPLSLTPSEPAVSPRAYGLFAVQEFSAQTTFEGVFGRAAQPFWGGGGALVFRGGLFVDVGISRFENTGQRAFRSNGTTFRLGIPLTATVTPIEFSGGYRFHLSRHPKVVPYVGAGVGTYGYKETSKFSDSSENVDTRHVGALVVGGAEVRVHPWIGIGVDAQYTHIPGILGTGGLSKDANENDLGGVSARFRLIVGR